MTGYTAQTVRRTERESPDSREAALNLLFLLIIFEFIIMQALAYICNRIGLRAYNITVSRTVYYAAYAALAAYYLFSPGRRHSQKTAGHIFLLFGILLLSYVFVWLMHPEYLRYAWRTFSFVKLFVYFPTVVYFTAEIRDYKKTMEYVSRYAILLAVFLWLVCLFTLRAAEADHNIEYGYYMAVLYCMSLYSAVCLGMRYNWVAVVGMALLVLMYGNRGSLLIVALYSLLLFFKLKLLEARMGKKIAALLLIAAAAMLVFFTYTALLEALLKLVEALGGKGRSIRLLLSGDISYTWNREIYHAYCTEQWPDMPLLGYGLLSDRYFCGGNYPHNIAIEMITQFGFLVGGALLVFLLIRLVGALRDPERVDITLAVGTCAVTFMFLSSSYLMTTMFWALVGVLMHRSEKEKHRSSVAAEGKSHV